MSKIDWSGVKKELALWRAEKIELPIWWRDDDAIVVTEAFETLVQISQNLGVPVHIAVIPKYAEPSLADVVSTCDWVVPMVHGWTHQSHAPTGSKNAEFGSMRDMAKVELTQALSKLKGLFGSALVPIFVPPWNRIDDGFKPMLAGLGYHGVSTYGARSNPVAAPGLTQINTHLDPIDWRGTRGLVPAEKLAQNLLETLQSRRHNTADRTEPLGILTHHLVHDPAIWAFTQDCLQLLLDNGATPCHLGKQQTR